MIRTNQGLQHLLPKVLRARDFHLYLDNGKRLTDLWLSGGKAVLGHKPPKILRELKNAAERGLFSPLPHPMEKRFFKSLSTLFPDHTFRLYMDSGSLYRTLENAGFTGGVPLLRPFFGDEGSGIGAWGSYELSSFERHKQLSLPIELPGQLCIPVLPLPLGPLVLVLAKNLDASFPPSEIIPPVVLAPATRALYDLAANICKPKFQRYAKIEKALGAGKSLWRRHGIYLTTEVTGEEYETLFKCFLDGGFLLPPSPDEPVILPAFMSKGEEVKLALLLAP